MTKKTKPFHIIDLISVHVGLLLTIEQDLEKDGLMRPKDAFPGEGNVRLVEFVAGTEIITGTQYYEETYKRVLPYVAKALQDQLRWLSDLDTNRDEIVEHGTNYGIDFVEWIEMMAEEHEGWHEIKSEPAPLHVLYPKHFEKNTDSVPGPDLSMN
ncbi:MAG: hypothetical protein KDJ35_01680 [Alphaproteobacteria bacterium]|nr:hypothetical protein [Alphaproteobacteria bacterium]